MLKEGLTKSLNNCIPCDQIFESTDDFKEHILTTIHNGPAKSTRSFKYKLSERTAKKNLIKGAKRQHLMNEIKQGATNIDFSDGSWLVIQKS